MKKIALIITLLYACLSIGCKKENFKIVSDDCWDIFEGDVYNRPIQYTVQHCNLTEEEFLNCTTCGYNGKVRDNISNCNYEISGVRRYYWEVKTPATTTYTGNYELTEKQANCFLGANGNLYRKK
jgi:hypothetical protein